MLIWNIALAIIWAAMAGEISLGNLLVGFAIGYFVLVLSERALGSIHYITRVRRAAVLVAYFLWELVRANVRLAYLVVAPTPSFRPGVIAYPVDGATDGEITLLANAITLTPGTLALHLSPDRRTLYLHTMYTGDLEGLQREIKERFERRMLELLR